MTETLEHREPAVAGDHRLQARLSGLIEKECGAGAHVVNFCPMEDGHAGLTFGFDVVNASGGLMGSLVLKLAPVGVTRRGNTDVYRQAPLLRGLKAVGMPVPGVPWASPNEDLLDTPFIVMERMPGRVFVIWAPHGSFSREPVQLRSLWLQAARLLARVHRVDWQIALPNWQDPRPLIRELEIWKGLLRHAQNPEWFAAGTDLYNLLAVHLPDEHPVGVVHGDFQPGNILYVNEQAATLIDWELASIGSQGLDVGWLLMMSDAPAWEENWRPLAPVSRDDLISAYMEAGGPATLNTNWYQGLAHFRLAAIACLNVKLHRTGKRVDEMWERFAPSISTLLARGMELAGCRID